jgi:hypothetical protein
MGVDLVYLKNVRVASVLQNTIEDEIWEVTEKVDFVRPHRSL